MNVKDYRKQVEARRGNAGRARSIPRPATHESRRGERPSSNCPIPPSRPTFERIAIQILQPAPSRRKVRSVSHGIYRSAYVSRQSIRTSSAAYRTRRAGQSGRRVRRQKLMEGLQGKGEALLATAAALGLLARDDQGSASIVARELLSTQSGHSNAYASCACPWSRSRSKRPSRRHNEGQGGVQGGAARGRGGVERSIRSVYRATPTRSRTIATTYRTSNRLSAARWSAPAYRQRG